MNRMKHIAAAVLLALAVPAFAIPAHAAPRESEYEREARIPLNRIVAQMEHDMGGRFMSADYNEATDSYLIIWRMPNGNMQRFRADAGSGRYSRAGGGER